MRAREGFWELSYFIGLIEWVLAGVVLVFYHSRGCTRRMSRFGVVFVHLGMQNGWGWGSVRYARCTWRARRARTARKVRQSVDNSGGSSFTLHRCDASYSPALRGGRGLFRSYHARDDYSVRTTWAAPGHVDCTVHRELVHRARAAGDERRAARAQKNGGRSPR